MDSTGTFSDVQGDTEGEAPHPVLAIAHGFPFAVRGGGDTPDSQSGQLCCSELGLELSALKQTVPMLRRTASFPSPLFSLAAVPTGSGQSGRIRPVGSSRAVRHRGRSPADRSCSRSGLPTADEGARGFDRPTGTHFPAEVATGSPAHIEEVKKFFHISPFFLWTVERSGTVPACF